MRMRRRRRRRKRRRRRRRTRKRRRRRKRRMRRGERGRRGIIMQQCQPVAGDGGRWRLLVEGAAAEIIVNCERNTFHNNCM